MLELIVDPGATELVLVIVATTLCELLDDEIEAGTVSVELDSTDVTVELLDTELALEDAVVDVVSEGSIVLVMVEVPGGCENVVVKVVSEMPETVV